MKKKKLLSLILTATLCMNLGIPTIMANTIQTDEPLVSAYPTTEENGYLYTTIDDVSYVTFENNTDAADYVRAQLVARSANIRFLYRIAIPNNGLANGTALTIYDEALKVTDSAVEGDYLRYNIRSRNTSTDVMTNDGEYSYYLISYDMTYLTTAAEESKLTTVVNNLITELGLSNSSLSDAQKTKLLYDYIAETVYYDHEGFASEKEQVESGVESVVWCDSHSAYSALANLRTSGTYAGKYISVCQGYALSVYRVLKELDIEVRFIRGISWKNNSEERDTHDFNIVKIDGKWYYLDANWGALFKENDNGTTKDVDYSWFLKSKQDFVYHDIDPDYITDDHEVHYLEDSTSNNYTSVSYGDSVSTQIKTYDSSYTLYNLNDKEITKPSNKIVVMTFFRNGWANTDYWLEELAGSSYFTSDNVEFYAIDVNITPDKAALIKTASSTGFGAENIMYQSSHYSTQAYLTNLATTMLTNAKYNNFDLYFNYNIPVTLIIDKSGKIMYSISAGKDTNDISTITYISSEYLDERIKYLINNPSSDTRQTKTAPTGLSTICMQRPTGTGIYAGSLVGLNDTMEYRANGSNIYYSGNSDSSNITGMTPGSYFVRYKGTNQTKPSAETELVVAPAAPRGTLVATPQPDCTMKLSWDATSGAKGYQIYRSSVSSSDESSFELIATTTATTYTDKTTEDGVTYYYKLKAYNTSTAGTKYYSDFSGFMGGTTRMAVKIYSAGAVISEKAMTVGTTYTLKYVISSAYSGETFKSASVGNTSIATVSVNSSTGALTVTPVSAGNTYLYVTTSGGYQGKCLLKVTSTIDIKESSISLYAGNTYKLSPTLTSNSLTVTYRTGNTAVAKVDSNGVITAVGAGNTYVYATSSKGHSDKVLVSVTKGIPATSLSIRYSEKTIYAGDTFTFTATMTPTNTTSKVSWRVGNTAVATVDSNGNVTGVSEGNTYLYATTDSGITVKCLLKIKASVPVESISLRYTSKTIAVGTSFAFTTTITPTNATNKNVTYHTGNTAVATVDSTGKVTGVSAGNTYLYATTANGVTTKCLIKVN